MPKSERELSASVDLQDIIMINLERLVQLSVDVGALVISEKGWHPIPDSMAGIFEKLEQEKAIQPELADRMKKSVGFRNLVVHEYDKINWSIVFDILTHQLADFRNFAKKMDALQ